MSRHDLTRDDVRLDQLATELGVAINHAVALSAQMPSASDSGVGVLVVLDSRGREFDADDAVVQRVIADHNPALGAEVDPAEVLEAALVKAASVNDLKTALLGYARAQKRQPSPPRRPSDRQLK